MTQKEREQQWKARIEAYKSNGLSKVAFCKEHNIKCKAATLLAKERIYERRASGEYNPVADGYFE